MRSASCLKAWSLRSSNAIFAVPPAALTGVLALCKEERGRTAEFLLTHPISRTRVVVEKWLAVTVQLLAAAAALAAGLCYYRRKDIP